MAFLPVEPKIVEPKIEVAAVKPVQRPQPRKLAVGSSGPTQVSMPTANRFLVIGSFAGQANARYLSEQHEDLEPTVVAATLDGRPRYRVVVGPFSGGEEKNMRRRLERAGIYDAWPIDLSVASWMEARRQPLYGNGEASQMAQAD
jgi:cell division protein FtsN